MNDQDKTKEHLIQELDEARRRIAELEDSAILRTHADAAIKKTDGLLWATFNATSDGILVVDRKGRISQWNSRFAEMWHIPRDILDAGDDAQVINYVLNQLPNPADFLTKVMELYGSQREEIDMVHFKDGRVFERLTLPVIDKGREIGRVWNFRDITAYKQVEDDLKKADERYKQSQKIGRIGNWEYSVKTGRMWGSEEAKRIFNFPPELIEVPIEDVEACIVEPMRVRQSMIDLLREGKEYNIEYEMHPVSTSETKIIWSIADVKRDEAGKPLSVTGLVQDITERRHAQAALSESEDKYRLLVENANEAIYVVQDSMLRFLNPKAIELIGYSKDELTARPFTDFVHPEDRKIVADRHLLRMTGQNVPSMYSVRIVANNGNIKWLENNVVMITWEDRPATLNFATDISKRKQALDALQKSEERYRSLFDNMLEGVAYCRISPDEDEPLDYIFLDVNSAFEKLTGLKDAVGKKVSEMIPGILSSNRGMLAIFREVAETGTPERIEAFLEPLGLWLAVSVYSMEPEYFVTVFDNITNRKKAEEALRERELFLKRSQEVGRIGSIIFDNLDKPVSRQTWTGTPILYDILGIDESYPHTIEKWRSLLVDPNEDREMFEDWSRDKTSTIDRKFQIVRPVDGQMRWISARGELEYDDQGNPTRVIGTITDITDAKAAEEERARLENQMQQTRKMESIGALAGGIAHDFNNILSAILGYTELAKMKQAERHDVEGELEQILKAGIRARELVKQILTFSRQSGIVKMPLEIVPLIKETLRFIRASVPATIEIRQNLGEPGKMVVADPTQIHQIIMNLCSNAAFAMKENGGVLDIALKEILLEDEAQLHYKGIKAGRYIQLNVSDTGTGIPKDIIDRIFDPFFTTKARGEGTGMGLSVIHGIVADMGGAISVYSEPGKGTTFRIVLPLYIGQAATEDDVPAILTVGGARILYVDDEEGVILSGRGILEKLGFAVTAMTNPIEALNAFGSDPNGFDLVLTDMSMPIMNGLEFAERLKQVRPDIPIIMSTGFSLGITPKRLENAGIRELVMKPMIAGELAQAISRALSPDKEPD